MASEDELAQRLAAGLASLGKQGFRAGQEEAVRAALDKHDALVVLPTGGGKSLCYMLAAQLQTGLCVVVSPLRALMKDQVDNAPLPVAALTSDTGEALKQRLFAQLEGHAPLGIKCLLVSPEMLHVNQKLVNALARLARRGMLSLVAIDEAHCVVDWGTSFRPAYTRLKAFIDTLSPRPPVMALTASAGEKGRAAIATALGLHEHRLVMTSFDRKNIRYEVRYPDSYDDPGWQNRNLLALLRGPDALGAPLRCGVVYCRAKDACEDVATLINKARIPGITAAAYHAGIGDKARRTVQADWRAGRITLAVATVAFGMGIDKADVRLVVHMQPPMTMTGWYQESGRAGRDGQPALAVMYFTADEERMGTFLSRKPPQDFSGNAARVEEARSASKAEFDAIREACRTPACLRTALLGHFGETLPRGACTAPGSAGCTACSSRSAMEAAIAAVGFSTGSNDSLALRTVRAAIAQGPAAMRALELDEFRFGLPSDEEDSDDGGDSFDEDAADPVAARAADVALAAHAGGGDAEECCGRAVDALLKEEAKHAAARPSNGRSGIATSLFGHRKPVAQAAAPRPAPRPAPAPRACSVDAAMRDAMRAKLAAAMNGDAAAAEAAETAVFAGCRGVVAMYDKAAKSAILDAQRSASRPAAGARSVRPVFVPPRAATTPQPAEAPQPPKLKSTRFDLPLPSEASKQAKTC